MEPEAHRAADWALPPLRAEERRGGRKFPEPEQSGGSAGIRIALREVLAL